MINSRYLLRLKREALRRRVWFKALSSLERGLVNFFIKAFDRPRSLTLVYALARIIVKVKRALMSPIKILMESVGKLLAEKISMIALKWGNKSALEWRNDPSFIRYLTIVDLNNIPGFRLSDVLLAK